MGRSASSWWSWVQRNLDAQGWTPADLARAVELEVGDGPDESVIGRWKNRGTTPTVDSIRAVATVFNRDFRKALIASGLVTARELNAPWARGVDLTDISDDDLAREVQARLTRPRPSASSAGQPRPRRKPAVKPATQAVDVESPHAPDEAPQVTTNGVNRTMLEPTKAGGNHHAVGPHAEAAPSSPYEEDDGAATTPAEA
jgi:transcriptional regulator with XRE-family HTH domain